MIHAYSQYLKQPAFENGELKLTQTILQLSSSNPLMANSSYECEKKSVRRGAQLTLVPTVCWKIRLPNSINILSMRK